MARAARRSIGPKPSLLTSSLYYSVSTHNSENLKAVSLSSEIPDPLRRTDFQLTTHTISKYRRNEDSKSKRSSYSPNVNNSSQIFDNINITNSTNSTYSKDFNNTDLLATERQRIRMEFYATYNVMTGVRIAATLGGFFGLMVFLVVYKSRNSSNETLKVLKDPKIAAVAAACIQEEENREIQEAMDATGLSIYPDEYDHMLFRRQRMLSLGNVSAPPIFHRGLRFSSIGGYCNLMELPRRYSYSGGRRKSYFDTSRRFNAYHIGKCLSNENYFIESDDEVDTEFDQLSSCQGSTGKNEFLEVPHHTGNDSRRSSGMTCCSTESSYLERRCSALTLGLNTLSPNLQARFISGKRRSSTDFLDYYYPDIQIIQATPRTSPCPSDGSTKQKILEDKLKDKMIEKDIQLTTDSLAQSYNTKISTSKDCHNNDFELLSCKKLHTNSFLNHTTSEPYSNDKNLINNSYSQNCSSREHVKKAPLASLSSFKTSSIEYQNSEQRSLNSDSVFVERYVEADTDDDMEQFSTDTDELSLSGNEKSSHSGYNQRKNPQSFKRNPKIINEKNKKIELEPYHEISKSPNNRALLVSQQLFKEQERQTNSSQNLNENLVRPSSCYTLSKFISEQHNTPKSYRSAIELSSHKNMEYNNTSNSNIPINRDYKKNDINKLKLSNKCMEVNIIIDNTPPNVSPSVILELPVISQDISPPRDLSLPGTSRKWSKETLF